MSAQTVLVIAAHPDDEALGCGGSLALHAGRGDRVQALFMTDGVAARGPAGQAEERARERRDCAHAAAKVIGICGSAFLDFPDNQMDSVPLLDIVRRIEPVVESARPDIVYTHHGGDLNVDHRLTHQAVMTALRPQPGRLSPTILCFEVASSTEWQAPAMHQAFVPNWFQDISVVLDRKLEALRMYRGEMRDWPHSRSLEALTHLARWRGATIGIPAAEAFVLARRIVR
jgi:N-acetylglucosamine malate deacetylase 1